MAYGLRKTPAVCGATRDKKGVWVTKWSGVGEPMPLSTGAREGCCWQACVCLLDYGLVLKGGSERMRMAIQLRRRQHGVCRRSIQGHGTEGKEGIQSSAAMGRGCRRRCLGADDESGGRGDFFDRGVALQVEGRADDERRGTAARRNEARRGT